MKKLIYTYGLFLLLLLPTFCFAQDVYCPPNIDFENGNTNHWQFFTGSCCPIVATSSSSAIPGRIELMSGGGMDYYGGFPVVPPGSGNYTLKLGNDQVGAEAEKAVYEFTIPDNVKDFSLIYKYAVVFEDPGHSQSEQPRFEVRIFDVSTNDALPCARYSYIATSNLPGFQNSTVSSMVLYRDWSVGSIKLSDYSGKTLRAEFSTGDCSQFGHFGYAYIDLSCGNFGFNPVVCEGTDSLSVQGPFGFSVYEWYVNNFSSIKSTNQNFHLPTLAGVDSIFLIIKPFSGFGCVDTLRGGITQSVLHVSTLDSLTICGSEPNVLQANVSGNSNHFYYSWSPDNLLSCGDCANPILQSNVAQNYYVHVQDQWGCGAEDSIYVESDIKACCKAVFIPNAFTPNNDGLNDGFTYKTP